MATETRQVSVQNSQGERFVATSHQSFLPDPESMKAYEAMNPGTLNRLLAMMEEQQKNRHKNDERDQLFRLRGQASSVVVVLASFTSAVIVYAIDPANSALLAAGIAGVPLAGVVALLIGAKIKSKMLEVY